MEGVEEFRRRREMTLNRKYYIVMDGRIDWTLLRCLYKKIKTKKNGRRIRYLYICKKIMFFDINTYLDNIRNKRVVQKKYYL